MSKVFKYRVCRTQRARVTFVNGRWQGLQIDNADADTLFNSCPMVWDYLEMAGREGWELVSTASYAESRGGGYSDSVDLLYLKKEESSRKPSG